MIDTSMQLLYSKPQGYAWIMEHARHLLLDVSVQEKIEKQINQRIFNNAFCGLMRLGIGAEKIETESGKFFRIMFDGIEYLCPEATVKNILRDSYEKVASFSLAAFGSAAISVQINEKNFPEVKKEEPQISGKNRISESSRIPEKDEESSDNGNSSDSNDDHNDRNSVVDNGGSNSIKDESVPQKLEKEVESAGTAKNTSREDSLPEKVQDINSSDERDCADNNGNNDVSSGNDTNSDSSDASVDAAAIPTNTHNGSHRAADNPNTEDNSISSKNDKDSATGNAVMKKEKEELRKESGMIILRTKPYRYGDDPKINVLIQKGDYQDEDLAFFYRNVADLSDKSEWTEGMPFLPGDYEFCVKAKETEKTRAFTSTIKVTVMKRRASISADAVSKDYDGGINAEANVTVKGLINHDVVDADYTAAFDSAEPGDRTVTVHITGLNGEDAWKYEPAESDVRLKKKIFPVSSSDLSDTESSVKDAAGSILNGAISLTKLKPLPDWDDIEFLPPKNKKAAILDLDVAINMDTSADGGEISGGANADAGSLAELKTNSPKEDTLHKAVEKSEEDSSASADDKKDNDIDADEAGKAESMADKPFSLLGIKAEKKTDTVKEGRLTDKKEAEVKASESEDKNRETAEVTANVHSHAESPETMQPTQTETAAYKKDGLFRPKKIVSDALAADPSTASAAPTESSVLDVGVDNDGEAYHTALEYVKEDASTENVIADAPTAVSTAMGGSSKPKRKLFSFFGGKRTEEPNAEIKNDENNSHNADTIVAAATAAEETAETETAGDTINSTATDVHPKTTQTAGSASFISRKPVQTAQPEPVVIKNDWEGTTQAQFDESKPEGRDYTQDGGVLFHQVHRVILKKKFGSGEYGPYRFVFWPIWIRDMYNGVGFADFLVHVIDPNGNESVSCTEGDIKELVIRMDGKEFKVFATWNSGIFNTAVRLNGDTDSMFTISEEVKREEPEGRITNTYLDQFRLERKGQPKHFIVPFKNNNRGEKNIPIIGYVELNRKRYPLERRDGNTLSYRYSGGERVIRGHWENGVFRFTVEDANRFL